MNAKDRFLKTPQAKPFADMATSETFKVALDYALLEFTEGLAQHVTAGDGALAHAATGGAFKFRRILEKLSFPEEESVPAKRPTLNYEAYDRPAR